MKDSKYYKKKLKNNDSLNTKGWLTKLLLSIIIVLMCLIITNVNDDLRSNFKKNILTSNISFTNIKKFYNKYIGGKEESLLVSNTDIDSLYEEYNGSYKIISNINESVEVRKPGIIVYIGEMKDLGNTVIVQGNDGIDLWYSNVEVNEYSLYDYVSVGDILGSCKEDYYIITIMNDGEFMKYEEYF